jgi:hypothetical protein
LLHVHELSADVRHAGDLMDLAVAIQFIETRTAICIYPAFEVVEILCQPRTLAVG